MRFISSRRGGYALFIAIAAVAILSLGSIAAVQSEDSDAASALQLKLSDAEVSPGGSFDVVLSMESNPGIWGISFVLGFDDSLELTSVTSGTLLTHTPGYQTGTAYGVFLKNSSPSSMTDTGTLLTFHFTASGTAAAGTHDLTVSGMEALNGDAEEVPCSVSGGSITVKAAVSETHTVTYSVDGRQVHQDTYAVGDSIVAYTYTPASGYTVSAWSPALPATMPARDLSVSATTSVQSSYSTQVRMALSVEGGSDATKVYLMMIGVDDKAVPSGTITVNYTYTSEQVTPFGKATVLLSGSMDLLYTSLDKAYAYVPLDLSGEEHYEDIVGASAVFTAGSDTYTAATVAFSF